MPFEAGKSGNPAGRPPGARNKTTLAMEALLEGDGEAIAQKAIDLAKAGDGPALRLCMERLYPVRRDRYITFELPELEVAADAVKASAAIVAGVAAGELTPSEAADLSVLVGNVAKALEVSDLEARLQKLEAGANK